jgi:triosephosphate isomerase
MRQSLVVGNWKMNGTLSSAELLTKGIIAGLSDNNADIAVLLKWVRASHAYRLPKGREVCGLLDI